MISIAEINVNVVFLLADLFITLLITLLFYYQFFIISLLILFINNL